MKQTENTKISLPTWETRRLKFAVSLRNEKIEAENSDLDYIGLEHIESWTGKLIPDESASSEGIATRFIKDDVLFGKLRPYLAKVYLAEQEGMATTEALVMTSEPVLVPAFLKYILLSDKFIKAVDGSTYGAKMPRANWETIGGLHISFPKPDEQRQIATFLDWKTGQIDGLIAKKQALLETLKEKRLALITQAVTKGLNPEAPLKDSGIPWLGKVPEHWEVKRLKFFTERVFTGSTPPSDESRYYEEPTKNWFTPSDFTDDGASLTNSKRKLNDAAIEDGAVRYFKQPCALIVSIGATLGRVGYSEGEFSCNQQINVVVPATEINAKFLFYSLYIKREAMKVISNATTLGIMNQEMTRQIEIAAPLLAEQVLIAAYLDKTIQGFDRLVDKIQTAVARLAEYRTALITAATTGKIDVRNIKIPGFPAKHPSHP
jgi:type I restriction enzyme S subunit